MVYGSPNIGMVASLFDITQEETLEFISNIPSDIYPFSVILFFLIVFLHAKRHHMNLKVMFH